MSDDAARGFGIDFGGDGFPALRDWSAIPPQPIWLSSHTNL